MVGRALSVVLDTQCFLTEAVTHHSILWRIQFSSHIPYTAFYTLLVYAMPKQRTADSNYPYSACTFLNYLI